MTWIVDSIASGWPVVEASGTARARFAILNAANTSEVWETGTSLDYALYAGDTLVLQGTADDAGFPYVETAITITTALDPNVEYRAILTGTVTGTGVDGTTSTVRYARREHAQTIPMRSPPITVASLGYATALGPAPASFADGTWAPCIDIAWATIGARILNTGRGDLVTPGALDHACLLLSVANVHAYLASLGSAASTALRDAYLARYSAEMDRLGAGWDTDGDGASDTTRAADGTGAGGL